MDIEIDQGAVMKRIAACIVVVVQVNFNQIMFDTTQGVIVSLPIEQNLLFSRALYMAEIKHGYGQFSRWTRIPPRWHVAECGVFFF